MTYDRWSIIWNRFWCFVLFCFTFFSGAAAFLLLLLFGTGGQGVFSSWSDLTFLLLPCGSKKYWWWKISKWTLSCSLLWLYSMYFMLVTASLFSHSIAYCSLKLLYCLFLYSGCSCSNYCCYWRSSSWWWTWNGSCMWYSNLR